MGAGSSASPSLGESGAVAVWLPLIGIEWLGPIAGILMDPSFPCPWGEIYVKACYDFDNRRLQAGCNDVYERDTKGVETASMPAPQKPKNVW